MKRLILATAIFLTAVGSVLLHARTTAPRHDCDPVSVAVSNNPHYIYLTVTYPNGDEFCGRLKIGEAEKLRDVLAERLNQPR